MRFHFGSALLVLVIAGAWVAGPSAIAQEGGGAAAASPASAPPADAAGSKAADELLTALEHADADLRTLTAEIRYDRTFELQGDRQTRAGRLVFDSGKPEGGGAGSAAGGESRRKFGILFDKLVVGERLEEEPQQFIFDGQWLIEKEPKQKQAQKRQVVPPGERFDPLRIGEGPFPIPIGQKRADILERYDAALVPQADGIAGEADLVEFASLAGGTEQLKLTPRAERAARDDFREIRIWYDADGKNRLLPRMARTVNRAGDVSVVQLIEVERNGPVDPALLDTTTPEGWDVQVTYWREAGAGERAGADESTKQGDAPAERGK